MDDIEIEKLFASIKPEDFFRDTSAIDDLLLNDEAATFDDLVDGLVAVVYRRAGANDFHPFAVLRNGTRQRIFLSEPDETPNAWAARLHREAVDMGASMFFVALLSPGRTYDGERPDDIPNTDEEIDKAIDEGRLEITLAWLAVGEGASRAGLIALNEDGTPGACTEGEIDGEGNPFMAVLGGDRAA